MHAIKSQVNEKPRDFLLDFRRKRCLLKEVLSEDKVVVEVLNLNFLGFLKIKCFILCGYSKILKSLVSQTNHMENYQQLLIL